MTLDGCLESKAQVMESRRGGNRTETLAYAFALTGFFARSSKLG